MSIDSALAFLIYAVALLIPWILNKVAQVSWKNWRKRGMILVLLIISTLFTVGGITTPQPQLSIQILISVWLIFTFCLTLISAYYAWPRTKK